MNNFQIELCAASIESLVLAKEFNISRVELCQNLETGGLTPSLAFQEFALSFSNFETHVLFRCRAGGFYYSEIEKTIMLRDIEKSAELGIKGFVLGSLNSKQEIDLKYITAIKSNFPQLELTFHRAFDDLQNPEKELEKLIDVGFKRVLTSGGKSNVLEGIDVIQKLVDLSKNRIEIMIGGGINANNIAEILQQTSPNAVHFSGTELVKIDEKSLFSQEILLPNRAKINGILKEINRSI